MLWLLFLLLSQTSDARLLANARRYLPNKAQREALIQELKQQEKYYDAKEHLLKRPIPSTANHYHSKLVGTTTHPFPGCR